MPEDEHIEPVVRGIHAGLPAGCRTGLVHHPEAHAAELRDRDLREALMQRRAVVVAVAADEEAGRVLDPLEQADVDPVTGVQHCVGSTDRRPDLVGQVACPPRDVCVG